ncbi:MAG: TIGR00730 family Rossman fold protein [Muribaculaceae bacterium]
MNVVVYCSSQENLGEDYEQMAQAVGTWIGSHGFTLVYGGVNSGLMRTVSHAVKVAGGKVVGVVPEDFEHRTDAVCDDVIKCRNLSDRKDIMIARGDIFICLPGGIGTLDEWISTISQQIVLGIENKNPIFAINYNGMYDALIEQLRNTAQSVFSRGKRIDCTHIASDQNSLINKLNDYISSAL